jgi:hypothetical protein
MHNPILLNIENNGPFLAFPLVLTKFSQTYQTLLHIELLSHSSNLPRYVSWPIIPQPLYHMTTQQMVMNPIKRNVFVCEVTRMSMDNKGKILVVMQLVEGDLQNLIN